MPLGGESIGRAYIKILADGSGLDVSIRDEFDDAEPAVEKAGQKHADKYTEAFEKGMASPHGRKRLSKILGEFMDDDHEVEGRLNRLRGHVTRFSDTVGRAFGRGSRNDFLNFTGAMARGFVRLGEAPIFALQKVGEFASFLGSTFTNALENGSSTLGALGTTAGSVGVAMAVGLTAAAAAAALLVLALGPLVALMSGLIGIITAVSASLTFGLIGAVGALVGTLAPATAGLVVLTAAFTGLDKGAKAVLKHDVRPVTRAWRELGAAARSPIFAGLEGQARKFGGAMRTFAPMFREIGQAISRVGDYFASALQSKGFTQFSDAMRIFLPNAVESLGKSFGNLVGGMGGVFRALIPITEEFLSWLQRVTGEFAHWANSDKGQDTLMRFFRRASDAASSFWNLLGRVKDVIVTLFDAGEQTGNNIIDDMARGLQHFNDFLKDNPDALHKWFTDARRLALDIGHVVTSLGHLADQLDDPDTREELHNLFLAFQLTFGGAAIVIGETARALAQVINGISKFKAEDIAGPFRPLLPILGGIGREIGKVFGSGFLGNSLRSTKRSIQNAFNGVGIGIINKFHSVPGGIKKNLGLAVGTAIQVKQQIGRAFTGIGPLIGSKFNSVKNSVRTKLALLGGTAATIKNTVVSKWNDVRSKITNKFNGIAGSVRGKLTVLNGVATSIKNSISDKFSDVKSRIAGRFSGIGGSIRGKLDDAVSAAGRIAGDIVDKFRGLAGRIVGAVGSIHLPTPSINWPHVPKGLGKFLSARGGMYAGAQWRVIGEAGPEAVVPLNRPLSQVDPAVRALSAIAQGKVAGMASGGVAGGGKTIDASGWTIVSPATDPEAVAMRAVNALVAQAY